jgi:septum formation protein
MNQSGRRLILASRSPRRRQLLEEAGFGFEACPAPLDDAHLSPGDVIPRHWVGALAYLKANAVQRGDAALSDGGAVILGSDTVVVKDTEIIGQPRDESDARRIIKRLASGTHRVMSGVALLVGSARRVFVDEATVRVGAIGAEQIEGYLATGDWQGKAGAYNLYERIDDGWPIEYEGDPTCVMGLPMVRLTPMLRSALETGTD